MLKWTLTCLACFLFLNACTPSRTKNWRHHGIRIVRSDELDLNTPQTTGMARAVAINHAMAGAKKLWAGNRARNTGVIIEHESIFPAIKSVYRSCYNGVSMGRCVPSLRRSDDLHPMMLAELSRYTPTHS